VVNKRGLSLTLAALALAASVGLPHAGEPEARTRSTVVPTEGMLRCDDFSSCTRVDAFPCGCRAGGSAIAINRQFAGEWLARRRHESAGQVCPAVISKDWTCMAEAVCENERCALRKK